MSTQYLCLFRLTISSITKAVCNDRFSSRNPEIKSEFGIGFASRFSLSRIRPNSVRIKNGIKPLVCARHADGEGVPGGAPMPQGPHSGALLCVFFAMCLFRNLCCDKLMMSMTIFLWCASSEIGEEPFWIPTVVLIVDFTLRVYVSDSTWWLRSHSKCTQQYFSKLILICWEMIGAPSLNGKRTLTPDREKNLDSQICVHFVN